MEGISRYDAPHPYPARPDHGLRPLRRRPRRQCPGADRHQPGVGHRAHPAPGHRQGEGPAHRRLPRRPRSLPHRGRAAAGQGHRQGHALARLRDRVTCGGGTERRRPRHLPGSAAGPRRQRALGAATAATTTSTSPRAAGPRPGPTGGDAAAVRARDHAASGCTGGRSQGATTPGATARRHPPARSTSTPPAPPSCRSSRASAPPRPGRSSPSAPPRGRFARSTRS